MNMSNKPSISVIIPSYNSRATIKRCVESVFATEYPALEVIIADDVSTDDSPQICEKMKERFGEKIKTLTMPQNGGPAKARNAGSRIASGEYLFFLDSDTEMLPDCLDNFVQRMQEADAVTGIYHYESLNKGWAEEYKGYLNYYFFARSGVLEYEVFDSSRAGIKAEVFRELGGFNETLGWGMDYENEELGYRLHQKYRNLLDPSVAVKHTFPGMKKLTAVYFNRVALWMEIFVKRRKFESGGVTTAETGLSSVALLLSIVLLPAVLFSPWVLLLSFGLFAVYFYGYRGFFRFVLEKDSSFAPVAILLNIYFTLVIACGASWGLFRAITGMSGAVLDEKPQFEQRS